MTVARLHLDQKLALGRPVRVAGDRAHYLRNVLRLRSGDEVLLFNAEHGEWRARVTGLGRHEATLEPEARARPPAPEPGPTLVFAPIRRNRLEWLVEKAVELGVARLVPVITRRSVVKPEGAERLALIAREAAEQCERLTLPEVEPPVPLAAWLDRRDQATPVLVALAREEAPPLVEALHDRPRPVFLIGPEGGFAPEERERFRAEPGILPVSLGPRILRTETAALTMLAVASQLG